MPLYDIFCDCGYGDEVVLKMDEEAPVCPKCGLKTKKAMPYTTFVLKGRGWAADNYSKDTGAPSRKKGRK